MSFKMNVFPKWMWMIALAVVFTGCSTGYHIHRANGIETLYHISGSGDKRIVYVVNDEGVLKVHDENDPIIRNFFSDQGLNDETALFLDQLNAEKSAHEKKLETQRLMRIGRIKAAKKRGDTDPIHVAVHETAVGPAISQRMGGSDKTKEHFKQFITEAIGADQIIHVTSHAADVDVYFKSFLKKTAALNIKTHKIVPVTAFHFEAYVQSNFLPDHRQTIKGLGHWFDHREVIEETLHRVNRFIRDEIGATIPKDREAFLFANTPSV